MATTPAQPYVLEVVPPRHGAACLASARAFLAAARVDRPLGLEIHLAGDGLARFCVRATGAAHLRATIAALRAVYPQAALRPLDRAGDPLTPRRGERLHCATLELAAPPYVPLRLLPDDEASQAPGADPLALILGALGPLPVGWRAGVQLVARPLPADHWGERVRRLALDPALSRERAEPHARADAASDLPSPAFLALVGLVAGGIALRLQLEAWVAAGDWARVAATGALLVALLIGLVALLARRNRRAPTDDHRLVAAKLAHPAYRVEMRLLVIAPAGTNPRVARAHLDDLAAAYRQFDAPGGNYFRRHRPCGGRRDPRSLTPLGPASRVPVLNAQELAGLWHLPAGEADLPVARTGSRDRLAPAEAVATGLRVGISRAGGREVPVRLPPAIAKGHQLLVARTQRGKSTLLLRLGEGVMSGDGALLPLDPQGPLARDALGLVPPERRDQVAFIDLRDPRHAVGLNPLDVGLGWPGEGAIEHALALFHYHFPENWGPRMADPFRMGLRTLYAANRARCGDADTAIDDAARDRQYTVYELARLLLDPAFRRAVLAEAGDPVAAQWWDWYIERALAKGGGLFQEVINPVLSKVNRFLASPAVHRVLGQPRSTLDPRAWVRDGAIVLIDGAHGLLGADTGGLLGGAFFNLAKLAIAAQEALESEERRPITLIVDEFQALPTADYETVLSAQAKDRANLIVATQGLATLDTFKAGDAMRPLRATLFDNVEALWVFQTSAENAVRLLPELGGADWLDANDLALLGRYQCYCRLFSGPDEGRADAPRAFRVALDPPPVPDRAVARAVAAASRARWTCPAATIDAAIQASWARHEEAATRFRVAPGPGKARGRRSATKGAQVAPAAQASFLPLPPLATTGVLARLAGYTTTRDGWRSLDRLRRGGLVSDVCPPALQHRAGGLWWPTRAGRQALVAPEEDDEPLTSRHSEHPAPHLLTPDAIGARTALYRLATLLLLEAGTPVSLGTWERGYRLPPAALAPEWQSARAARLAWPARLAVGTDADGDRQAYILLPVVSTVAAVPALWESALIAWALARAADVEVESSRRHVAGTPTAPGVPRLVVVAPLASIAAWHAAVADALSVAGLPPGETRVAAWPQIAALLDRGAAASERPPVNIPSRAMELAQCWPGWSHGRDAPAALIGRAQPMSMTASEDAGRIVGLVARHPFLTAGDVATLQGLSRGSAYRLCRRLQDDGLLRPLTTSEYPAGSGRGTYLEVTRAGLTAAATRDGLTLAQAITQEGFAGGGPEDPLGARSRLLTTFAHTRGCATFVVTLVRAGQDPCSAVGQLLDWRNPVAAAGLHARPDATLAWHRACDGQVFHAWLEFDRGTERGEAIARKCGAYAREAADWAGLPLPTLLIMATSDAAEARLAFATACFLEPSSALARVPILLTTTDRLALDPAGPLGEVWRYPGTGMSPRVHWVP